MWQKIKFKMKTEQKDLEELQSKSRKNLNVKYLIAKDCMDLKVHYSSISNSNILSFIIDLIVKIL